LAPIAAGYLRGMPYWAIICIVGAVVWFLGSPFGGLIIAIGVIVLLAELLGGGKYRYRV
jgi:hypothetical protein